MLWIKEYFNDKWNDIHKKSLDKPSIVELLKISKLKKVNIEVNLIKILEYIDYIREDYTIKSEGLYYIPISVLKPKDNIKNIPVIALHGHGGGGRLAVIGDRSNPRISESIDRYNYDYGLQMVKKGYTVFCPNNRGFDDSLSCKCRELSNLSNAIGLTLTGLMVWDISRVIDAIDEFFNMEIKHLACIGFSGGGALALYSSAVDCRIQYTIISGYIYGFRESHLELYGNCSCNYIPCLWEFYDMADIVNLVQNDNVFIETGAHDHLNGISNLDNVTSQISKIKTCIHRVYPGTHKFYGVDCFDWLSQLIH